MKWLEWDLQAIHNTDLLPASDSHTIFPLRRLKHSAGLTLWAHTNETEEGITSIFLI